MAGKVRKPGTIINRTSKPSGFAIAIGQTIDDIIATTEDDVRKITLGIWGNIVQATPKDTGRAQSGWIATVAKPSAFKPDPDKKRYALNQPKGLGRGSTQLGVDNFIINNVNYVIFLNQGTSKQAAAMFVEIQIAKTLNIIAKTSRKQ